MTGKQRFQSILRRQSSRSGFWHGQAHGDSIAALNAYFGTENEYELGKQLGDDTYWAPAESFGFYRHPEGRPVFDVLGGKARVSLNQDGVFADATLADVESHPWPDPQYLDFSDAIAAIDHANADGLAVMSGCWSPFFHLVCDYFGMENCFVAMHESPEVVEAVTNQVVDFYLEANKRLFDQAADRIDAFFFGNDFGSQLDCLISPECFDCFVLPSFRRLTDQAKSYGLPVILHSCGSIHRVIGRLIDAGVDILHPIQARAAGMDAETLNREFGKDILFMGGLDTQELMPFGTPRQVRDEVYRLRELFGPNFILSPSHECILPVVPPANVEAMARAATEQI